MIELTLTVVPLSTVPLKLRRRKYAPIIEAGQVLGRDEALQVDGLTRNQVTGLKLALKKVALEGVARRGDDGCYAVFVSRPPKQE